MSGLLSLVLSHQSLVASPCDDFRFLVVTGVRAHQPDFSRFSHFSRCLWRFRNAKDMSLLNTNRKTLDMTPSESLGPSGLDRQTGRLCRLQRCRL